MSYSNFSSRDVFFKPCYTVKELIAITSLSRTTIWKAIKKGKLKKCSNTGRRVLISAQALEEFLGIKKGGEHGRDD